MDTTGAENTRPEQNQAANTPEGTNSPQNIVEQRLAEISNRNQQASDTEVPKEEQPEMQPSLQDNQEAHETENITEVFAEANTNVVDADVSAESSEGTAAGETGQSNEIPTSDISTTQTFTAAPEAEEEDTFEDESQDYSQLSIDQLRQQLIAAVKGADARTKYKIINEMQRFYDLRFQAERHEALDKFKQEGGADEDFDYHASSEHQDLEKLLTAYRDSRHQDRQSAEQQRQQNLTRKKALLQKLRELVESAETKSSSDELKKLQQEWKTIGSVPPGEAQELWDSYHALLDIFYNNRSMFFEMKELDRKRNLDAKLHLVERAEALQNETSINKALEELRHLHEEWKNIGPVPNDQRDPIWERFIAASEKVHEQRRSFHQERNVRENENLVKKRALLERLQAFQGFTTDRINDWRDKTDEIQKLKEEWDAAGLVPKEHAEEINKAFWGNYKGFFQHKNQFFKSLDEQKAQNLRLKTELCEQAEQLKESTDWNATKEKLIQLQKKWKTIGRVPDKFSDKIWNRFRTACNEFFDKKQAVEQQRGAELDKLSAEKMQLCDHLAGILAEPNAPATLEEFNGFVNQWRQLDAAAGRKYSAKAEEKFVALMEKYLERVPTVSYDERTEIIVKLQVERLKQSPDAGQKLQQREQGIRREVSHLQNDIQTLRTNIEFFARSKNADKLREEYEGRIAEAQKRIDLLNKQLQAFRG